MIKLRRVLRKLTGVNPPVRLRKPTNMVCYVKYSTTQKLLVWLESQEVPVTLGERTGGHRRSEG